MILPSLIYLFKINFQVGPAVQYSLAENRIRSAPPVLGEHTDSVLANILGYSSQTIQLYRDKGIIT